MVSEDSTSRVMVLPVTVKMLACCDEVATTRGAKGSRELTSLDEDLHDCGCLEGVFEVCVLYVD